MGTSAAARQLGKHLRILRGGRNTEDVASRAGMSVYAYQRTERGQREVNLSDIAGLCLTFQITPDELCGLAGVWELGSVDTGNVRLDRVISIVKSTLISMDSKTADIAAEFLLVDVQAMSHLRINTPESLDNAELPEWFRKRHSVRGR